MGGSSTVQVIRPQDLDGTTVFVNPQGKISALGGSGTAAQEVAVAFSVTEGQTVFPMPRAPTNYVTVRLAINSVEYRWPLISVSATQVVWQNGKAAGGFDLDENDTVELIFT